MHSRIMSIGESRIFSKNATDLKTIENNVFLGIKRNSARVAANPTILRILIVDI